MQLQRYGFPTVQFLGFTAKGTTSMSSFLEALKNRKKTQFETVNKSTEQHLPVLLKEDNEISGRVFVWGRNVYGRCGNGTTENLLSPVILPRLWQVIGVNCGAGHSIAWTVSGSVFTWGKNYLGQLGVGDTEDRYYPTHVASLREVAVIDASGGGNFSAFVTKGASPKLF